MLMICWFYCIPFAKVLYFAAGGLVVLFSLFLLRRGVRVSSRTMRQWAFALMFLSAIKIFVFDIRLARDYILCGVQPMLPFGCSKTGFMILELGGLVLLVLCSAVLFQFYRLYMRDVKRKPCKPEDVNLRFWADASMVCVCAMIVWTMAPWVGYLTVGRVPALFTQVQWQFFAIANFILLLIGFWKVESCDWDFDPKAKMTMRSKQAANLWTPRDTLWLNVFLYLVTLALSYVAHDILSKN
jgi:hypothetical protein